MPYTRALYRGRQGCQGPDRMAGKENQMTSVLSRWKGKNEGEGGLTCQRGIIRKAGLTEDQDQDVKV